MAAMETAMEIRWGSMGMDGAPCPIAWAPRRMSCPITWGHSMTEPKHLEAGTNQLNQPIYGMYKSCT